MARAASQVECPVMLVIIMLKCMIKVKNRQEYTTPVEVPYENKNRIKHGRMFKSDVFDFDPIFNVALVETRLLF